MNNVIMRSATVTATYAALVSSSLTGSVTISCPATNAGVVYFLGDDGSDVPWQPGEWQEFRHVDLSTIRIKGTAGDTVTLVGGTW